MVKLLVKEGLERFVATYVPISHQIPDLFVDIVRLPSHLIDFSLDVDVLVLGREDLDLGLEASQGILVLHSQGYPDLRNLSPMTIGTHPGDALV